MVQSGNPSEALMTKSPRQTRLCLHSISEGQRVVVYNRPLQGAALEATFSSSSCRICVLCGTLPLSLEICKMAGKPSRALRSHSLNLLLNSRTDFRYWILTSSRKSGRRMSSRPCRERIQQYDLACCGRCCQHLTQGPGRHGRSERGH